MQSFPSHFEPFGHHYRDDHQISTEAKDKVLEEDLRLDLCGRIRAILLEAQTAEVITNILTLSQIHCSCNLLVVKTVQDWADLLASGILPLVLPAVLDGFAVQVAGPSRTYDLR